MNETLYLVVEGPKGKAEVFEVIQEVPKDAQQREGWVSSRPGDTRYDVRFAGASQSFWSEGEAAIAAQELAGAATE